MNKLKYLLLLTCSTSIIPAFAEKYATCKVGETVKRTYECCTNTSWNKKGTVLWVASPKDCSYYGGVGWNKDTCTDSITIADKRETPTEDCQELGGEVSLHD